MSFLRGLVLVVIAILLVGGAGAWFYLFGPNAASSAKLVPADTIAFAEIPNATSIAASYETSQLRKLADAPEAQPLFDEIQHVIGDKNLALLKVLLPDLSGQSFVALTHFDPNKPSETGFVAAMKPKAGTDHFDAFITQLNAAYPDLARETKTGKDQLLGVDYQWIEGAHSPGRVCVARYHGWIVTAWGEASLQDWIERMQGKSATPSLAENTDYEKSVARVGKGAQAFLYLDYRRLGQLWLDHMAKINPDIANRMRKQIAHVGGAAIGTRFDNGEIVDRFSILEPKASQIENGVVATPCPFDTLKFTGPDTRFYLGANMNWEILWKNFQDEATAQAPGINTIVDNLQSWAQSENIDIQKNIVDALGAEFSIQMEWAADSTYPDLGVMIKIDKPDAFKPAIAAIVDTARKAFATSAIITEMASDGHNYATLKMVRPMPISPTITEDGPYFGLFLNAQHAVRSMARDESRGLLHNDDFNREIGNQRNDASEIIYFDTPKFVDQAYRTAMPFVSMGAMFNPTLASLLKGHQLPPDVTWLAPMGSWAAVMKSDEDGISGYSRSGIGNQGILLAAGAGGTAVALQAAGIFHPAARYTTPVPGNPNAPTPPAPVSAPLAPVVPPPPVSPATPLPPSDANSNSTTPPPPADSTH